MGFISNTASLFAKNPTFLILLVLVIFCVTSWIKKRLAEKKLASKKTIKKVYEKKWGNLFGILAKNKKEKTKKGKEKTKTHTAIREEKEEEKNNEIIKDTIFVSIYVPLGEELGLIETLCKLYERSSHPERLTVGFCWILEEKEFDINEGYHCRDFVEKYCKNNISSTVKSWIQSNVKCYKMNMSNYDGECSCRRWVLQFLFRDQKYYLDIRNNTTMKKDWEGNCIKQLWWCERKNNLSILTQGIAIEPTGNNNGDVKNRGCFFRFSNWNEFGMPIWKSIKLEKDAPIPFISLAWSCDFSFCRSSIMKSISPWEFLLPFLPFYVLDWMTTIHFLSNSCSLWNPSTSMIDSDIQFIERGDPFIESMIKDSGFDLKIIKEKIIDFEKRKECFQNGIYSSKSNILWNAATGVCFFESNLHPNVPFRDSEIICKYGSIAKFLEFSKRMGFPKITNSPSSAFPPVLIPSLVPITQVSPPVSKENPFYSSPLPLSSSPQRKNNRP